MNHWIKSSLLMSATLLVACSSNSYGGASDQYKQTGKHYRSSPAPQLNTKAVMGGKQIPLTAPEFREDAPDRYVVQRGDTLWKVAAKFLKNPARWREVWHANPQIKDPNRVYPGDVLAYKTVGNARRVQVAGSSNPVRGKFTGRRTSDGRPIYNVSPTVQIEPLSEPIPAVPKDVVFPFMTKNRIMEPGASADYPYVVGQADGGYMSLTGRDKVYARTDGRFDSELYDVFREAGSINDPLDGVQIGVEAVYVGQLKLVGEANEDGVATFVQTDKVNPLYAKDILIPSSQTPAGGDLTFMPKLPSFDDNVVVIRPLGTSASRTASQFSTLLINAGSAQGVQEGDVYKIVRGNEQEGVGRDGERFTLPDYESGMGIVYKTNSDTAYLLVMNANDVIYPGDRLVRP